jgi:N-acetylglucosamine-6-sulfatase
MTRGGGQPRPALSLAGIVAVASAVAVASVGTPDPARGGEGQRPNLVVVMTDDQTLDMLDARYLPNTVGLLQDRSTGFTDFVTQPLCCPSRAEFLTGQYPHNNGVFTNNPGYATLRHERNTLPVWLQRAGYRTALVGKYLNRYTDAVGLRPAPGFSLWYQLMNFRYRHALIDRNGDQFRAGAHQYVTNLLTSRARDFVRRARGPRPFFLWLSYLAPHSGGGVGARPESCESPLPVPATRDEGRFADEPLPQPPSFNEANVNDKPSFVRGLPPLESAQVDRMTAWYRCALEALQSVDRGVRGLVRTLRSTGEWRNTVVVFTSDNGFLYGQHRLPLQKSRPYEEALRVPLLMRLPRSALNGNPTVHEISVPTAGVDLAPTLLDLAGATPCAGNGRCRVLDGRSLLPLLRGHGSGWPTDRAFLAEIVAKEEADPSFPCSFSSVRTPTRAYSEYPTVRDPDTGTCVPSDEAELYHLDDDPFELDNLLAGNPSPPIDAERAALEARMEALRTCAGTSGVNACE